MLGLYSDTVSSTTSYFHHLPGGSNQILGETIGKNTYYFLTDLRGSVVKVTDGIGDTKNTYSYDPYGTLLASTGMVSNPIRYVGGYFDSATGLYKFGARYYNSSDARWTQLDPRGQDFGYLYAGNDPVNFADPSGLIKLNSISGYLILGCGTGLATYGVGLIAVSAATGVGIAASPFEALGSCAIGAVSQFSAYAGNNSGSQAFNTVDTTRTFLNALK